MSNILQKLQNDGFAQLHEPDLLELINVGAFDLLNKEERLRDNGEKDIHPDLAMRMRTAAVYLQTKYLDPTFDTAEFKKFLIWDGVDKDNQHWHTDLFEGMNCFFLFYMDDMHPESGGAINFKKGQQVWTIYPKAGDLFLVNNLRGFFHKADACSLKTRRVASFDFLVTGL
jgi:hypothetical protein